MKKSNWLWLALSVLIVMAIPIWRSADAQAASSQAPVEFTLLQQTQFTRTTGAPDLFNETFLSTFGQGKLIIKNGTLEGKNRVSSGLVVLNGLEVIGPSSFNQRVYDLEIPINLIENNCISIQLNSKPGSYITVEVREEIPVDATATSTIGPEGGVLSIENHLGDKMTLEIPPLALTESVPISISTLAIPAPCMIGKNVWPGAILEPSGLIFSLPAKLSVDLHEALITNPDLVMLYDLRDPTDFRAVYNVTATQNHVEGEIWHFSCKVLGEPVDCGNWPQLAELILKYRNELDKLEGNPLYQLLAFLDQFEDLLTYSKLQDIVGCQEAGPEVLGYLEEEAQKIVSSPLPTDPCGLYSIELQRLKKLVGQWVDKTLAELIDKKSCHLAIVPDGLDLNPGRIGDFSAMLEDSNGNKYPCSSMNWDSSDSAVAEIVVASDSGCTVKAGNVEDETATITANCGGLIGTAPVHVRIEEAEAAVEIQSPPNNCYLICADEIEIAGKVHFGSGTKVDSITIINGLKEASTYLLPTGEFRVNLGMDECDNHLVFKLYGTDSAGNKILIGSHNNGNVDYRITRIDIQSSLWIGWYLKQWVPDDPRDPLGPGTIVWLPLDWMFIRNENNWQTGIVKYFSSGQWIWRGDYTISGGTSIPGGLYIVPTGPMGGFDISIIDHTTGAANGDIYDFHAKIVSPGLMNGWLTEPHPGNSVPFHATRVRCGTTVPDPVLNMTFETIPKIESFFPFF